MSDFRIETVESAPFAENSYIVWRPDSTEAVVFDPGFEPERIIEVLQANKLTLSAILNTHGHVDHIAGNEAMKQAFPGAPLVIGHGDAAMLIDPWLNMSAPFGVSVVSPPADRTIADGERIAFAGLAL